MFSREGLTKGLSKFLGKDDKDADDEKRLEDLENRGACCVCESDFQTSAVSIDDVNLIAQVFDLIVSSGFLCKICRDVATSKQGGGPASSAATDMPAVNRVGEWPCTRCGTLNSAFALVCDKCAAPRPESSQGVVYNIKLESEDDELGLDCEIECGAVRIMNVTPGSAAARHNVELGILTMIQGKLVHSSSDLKKTMDKVRASGVRDVEIRVSVFGGSRKKQPTMPVAASQPAQVAKPAPPPPAAKPVAKPATQPATQPPVAPPPVAQKVAPPAAKPAPPPQPQASLLDFLDAPAKPAAAPKQQQDFWGTATQQPAPQQDLWTVQPASTTTPQPASQQDMWAQPQAQPPKQQPQHDFWAQPAPNQPVLNQAQQPQPPVQQQPQQDFWSTPAPSRPAPQPPQQDMLWGAQAQAQPQVQPQPQQTQPQTQGKDMLWGIQPSQPEKPKWDIVQPSQGMKF